jgi:cytochrome c oxidase cbb3-type subunit 1
MIADAHIDKTRTPQSEDISVRIKLSEIDRSMKWPAIFFTVSSLLWLILGSGFALIAAIKLTTPDFLADYEWLTFGRARSAHLNSVIYGWGNNVIFAVAPWIMARLCRTPVRHIPLICFGGILWNIAITIGIIGILNGDMTSVEWLEMPTYITPLVAMAYAMIAVWCILTFRYRQSGHIYVSQWYILAAFFWLPWLYSIAQIMILFEPARGVVQALTNWWFAHNVLGLWLTPVALATTYYLIPKVLGVPIHSYYLSVVGFWTLALFYNWAGVHHLIGGPIPVWLISAGTVASVMMVIPVLVTAINHHMTVVGHFKKVWESPTLRFVVFGAMNYTLVSLIGSSMALRSVNEVTHFTQFTVGHAHHGVYAFFTMIMFGGIYYMMPRILNREWPSAFLIRVHFWSCAIGVMIMLFALHIAGWIQGMEMNALTTEGELLYPQFIEIMKNTVPWLHARSLSGMLISVGHIAFAMNVFWMLLSPKQTHQGPTLLIATESAEG